MVARDVDATGRCVPGLAFVRCEGCAAHGDETEPNEDIVPNDGVKVKDDDTPEVCIGFGFVFRGVADAKAFTVSDVDFKVGGLPSNLNGMVAD